MNDLRRSVFELREPLEPHPLKGLLYGALTGAFFAWLADPSDFRVDVNSVVGGYVLGGMAAGSIIGGLLPAFRVRWLAACIVGFSITVGATICWFFWEEMLPIEFVVFFGFAATFFYYVLLWDYRPD